ncbi:MAG: NAD(+) synthase [Alistipes sp.]|nr:NAD(+) synthase [Alistipes sp.]
MNNFGFIKVAAAIPSVRVADCDYNSQQIIAMMTKAANKRASVVVFPELSITSATCGDLYQQSLLMEAAEKALKRIVIASHDINITAIVGLPVAVEDKIYNCAAVVANGKLICLIPKQYTSKAESRWFTSGLGVENRIIGDFIGQDVSFGANQLVDINGVKIGVEIGEDMQAVIPPSTLAVESGAKVICNLAATIQTVGKYEQMEDFVTNQTQRLKAAYVYASAGFGESTTDYVYAGDALVAECGLVINSAKQFSVMEQLVIADVDVDLICNLRQASSTISRSGNCNKYAINTISSYDDIEEMYNLDRSIDPMPFVPSDELLRDRVCEEVFAIQVLGLMKRLKHTSCHSAIVGISGGLDSTLALLVTVKAFQLLGLDCKGILGITMPGFGTTDRTYRNAVTLIKELGVTFREIPIAAACRQHFADIGLAESDRSVTFENAQARERTQILMDVANQCGGMVIGTGDMSELALGWATYNGDQMSMYGVNCNVPKTLVRHIVLWKAKQYDIFPNIKNALIDVVDTPVSPELLPASAEGEIKQKTEDLVGPYELHDFFLYHFLHNGFSPAKILFLAENAFNEKYGRETIVKWLKTFFHRFFSQQFKRSASPDSVKVGIVGLSPRGDWNMPSDASAQVWLNECNKL